MDLKKLQEALDLYIRPQTFPLAIKMLESARELPQKARIPTRDLGGGVTVCQGVGIARKYGWTVAIGEDDQVCPMGSLALGFVPPKKEYMDGSVVEVTGGWTREVMKKRAQAMPRLPYGKYSHMLMAPLHSADFEPHVILLYGNSAQVMRLVQGRLHEEGGELACAASGSADCADIVARTMLRDEAQVVLPCNGDRIFGMAQDHEMAFALPPSKLETTLRGLAASHSTGAQRYPIPSYFRFQPQMPPAYQKLLEFLKR